MGLSGINRFSARAGVAAEPFALPALVTARRTLFATGSLVSPCPADDQRHRDPAPAHSLRGATAQVRQ